MNEKFYSEKEYEIRYCDVDFRDELKPSALACYFMEMAGINADRLGFGYDEIMPNHLGFILTGVYYECLQPIRLFDRILFKTWPVVPRHVIFLRDFSAYRNGELAVRCTSRWCLMQLDEMKILSTTTLKNQDYSSYPTEHIVEHSCWKTPLVPKGNTCTFSVRIANSEYDHYMHVNNTRYVDYCFNVFKVSELQHSLLKSFQINYLRQCHEGDFLEFFRQEIAPGRFYITGYNEETAVVSAEIVLTEE